jgi:hypothetical protein
VFSPYTAQNKDPINLLFAGGGVHADDASQCTNLNQSGRRYITPACVVTLHDLAWRQGPGSTGGHMKPRMCNGHDTETFYPQPGSSITQRNPVSVSTSSSCRNQWHLRLWSDADVNDQYTNGEWTVGVIYREKRCALALRDTDNCYGKGSHQIAENWETSEKTEIYQMGTSTNGEPAYCTYPDYRVVPGQRPGKDGNYRGRLNDGRISRISAQRILGSAPRGRKCVGG